MARAAFSPNWYRFSGLRPRLKGHIEIHEHIYRGVEWRIVEDRQTGRFHRLTPAAYYFVCMMDGRRTVDEVQQLTERRYGPDAPTQDDAIRLLAQLHGADLLVGDGVPDFGEVDSRARQHAHRMLMSRVKNPMAIRIPLADPDRFIVATLPLIGWLFSPVGFVMWLAVVVAGIATAALNWPELTENLSDRALSTQNILIAAMVYPAIKLVHELAHAYAVRRWGGEVHEIGIMFLVLLPVPYVDASAATAYREWTRRAVVAGAGVFVELGLAAAATILWSYAEPGVGRAVLFNVALIGGISTVLFNGNPLLRFDGYYMLSDAIAIPNLGTRANAYMAYLVQRYAFGVEDIESPVAAPSERRWLVVYAIASFMYRVTVMIGISLFISTQFFFIGVLLAMLVVANMLLFPIGKALAFVLASPKLHARRRRAVVTTGGALLGLAAALGVAPFPYATVAEGVVIAPEAAHVRAGTAGVVARLVAADGAEVAKGALLARLEDPTLFARLKIQQAEIAALNARRRAALAVDPVVAGLVEQEIAAAGEELRRIRERVDALDIRAPRAGRWVVTADPDLEGLFVGRGDVLGYVRQEGDRSIRAVVPQSSVDLVRLRLEGVEVRFVHEPETAYPARLIGEAPAAGRRLPSPALTVNGGGRYAVDPTVPDGLTTLDPVFQFDLTADYDSGTFTGERVYVRFDHGAKPILGQAYLAVRRLFLSALNV